MQLMLNEYGSRAGIPLVLLHGFPMDSRVWQPVVDQSSGRIITADWAGFGRSSNNAPFTMQSAAGELHRGLKEVGALPCVLCGLSMGGYLSLAFAAQFSTDLAGLILVDTKAAADEEQGKQARGQMIELARSKGTPAVVEQMLPKMFGTSVDPEAAESFRQMMLESSPIAIEHATTAMRDRPDFTPVLRELKCPLLILVGEQDRITPPAIAIDMHRSHPGAEMIMLSGAGHMSPVEQPMQVAFAINFFRERRVRPAGHSH